MKKAIIAIWLTCIVFISSGCIFQRTKDLQQNKSVGVFNVAAPQDVIFDGVLSYSDNIQFVPDAAKGTIDKVYVTDKQKVKKGESLFSYKDDQIIQQCEELKNQLKKLENLIVNLNKQMEEPEVQAVQKSTIKSQIDENKQQQQFVSGQLNKLSNKQNITVTAPIDGVVFMDSANNSGVNKSLLTLVNPKIQVEASASEKDVLKLQEQQEVTVRLYSSGKEIKGKVVKIGTQKSEETAAANSAQPGNNVSYYPVYIDIDQDEGLRIGFHVQIAAKPIKENIKVPKSSIITTDGKNYVWYVNKGKSTKKEVSILPWNDNYVEIKDGLSVGDKIIREASKDIKEGELVENEPVGN